MARYNEYLKPTMSDIEIFRWGGWLVRWLVGGLIDLWQLVIGCLIVRRVGWYTVRIPNPG